MQPTRANLRRQIAPRPETAAPVEEQKSRAEATLFFVRLLACAARQGRYSEVMPPGNVQIVRTILDQWEHGNFASETMLFDPEITFETFMPDASEKVVVHGSTEVGAFTREWLAQWSNYRIVAGEFRAVGPDKVFVSLRQVGTGRYSGVEVDSPGFSAWTLRDGKVVELSLHYDEDEARQAVGLST